MPLLLVTVFLDEYARERLCRQAVQWRLRETGGSIFGWEQDDDIVIACVSGPGPKAKHRRSSFEPVKTTTQAAIARVLGASGGRYGYLGSWHTHPRGTPIPSGTDSVTARLMARQEDLELPNPLLLILSTTGSSRRVRPRELRGWRWSNRTGSLVETDVGSCVLSERSCPDSSALFLD